jgi:hypothetical protein
MLQKHILQYDFVIERNAHHSDYRLVSNFFDTMSGKAAREPRRWRSPRFCGSSFFSILLGKKPATMPIQPALKYATWDQ